MKNLINAYLYSNLHIALGSAALCIESYYLHRLSWEWNYVVFVFCGTLLIYNLHRIIGTRIISKQISSTKFDLFRRMFVPMLILSILSLITCFLCYLNFSMQTKLALCIPAIISLLYVVPITKSYKRIRDLPYIKIFLIAISWSLLCYAIPIADHNIWMIFERFCFLMAITIPFDIRDIHIDQQNQVPTLVSYLESGNAKKLALVFLAVSFIIQFYFLGIHQFSIMHYVLYTLMYLVTAYLIFGSSQERKDQYYTGWLDGTLILRVVCILPFII